MIKLIFMYELGCIVSECFIFVVVFRRCCFFIKGSFVIFFIRKDRKYVLLYLILEIVFVLISLKDD